MGWFGDRLGDGYLEKKRREYVGCNVEVANGKICWNRDRKNFRCKILAAGRAGDRRINQLVFPQISIHKIYNVRHLVNESRKVNYLEELNKLTRLKRLFENLLAMFC